MKRLFPHPFASLIVLVMWLLLAQSPSPGQLALGALVAWIGGHAFGALRTERIRISSLRPAFKLAATFAVDVVRSNLAVAWVILFPRERISGFVRLPLELDNIHGLSVLACIITATPGTLWVRLDRASGTLTVHVLDLVDEQTWIDLIKNRYEAPLIEIFGK